MNGLMDTFGTSISTTSTISSIQTGMLFCISPIASYLINKFGCRKTTFVGSMVAAIGLFTSGLAQSIELLYLTAGLCTGEFIFFYHTFVLMLVASSALIAPVIGISRLL